MFGISKESSNAIGRPFPAALLRKARIIAESYQIILHEEDGEYYGRAVEWPNVMNDGRTPNQCIAATREFLTTAIAYTLEASRA
jgi:predicted RNase H-like HicB family nuclease